MIHWVHARQAYKYPETILGVEISPLIPWNAHHEMYHVTCGNCGGKFPTQIDPENDILSVKCTGCGVLNEISR